MSVCLSVRPSVCPSVRVFTFEVLFKRLFAPLPEVRCAIFLEIQNPWGKIIERNGLRFDHFCLKVVLNRQKRKIFFWLILPTKQG